MSVFQILCSLKRSDESNRAYCNTNANEIMIDDLLSSGNELWIVDC